MPWSLYVKFQRKPLRPVGPIQGFLFYKGCQCGSIGVSLYVLYLHFLLTKQIRLCEKKPHVFILASSSPNRELCLSISAKAKEEAFFFLPRKLPLTNNILHYTKIRTALLQQMWESPVQPFLSSLVPPGGGEAGRREWLPAPPGSPITGDKGGHTVWYLFFSNWFLGYSDFVLVITWVNCNAN